MRLVVTAPQWIAIHWKAQGQGLAFLAFLSFYPAAFHYQEYLFFVLLFTAIGVAVYQGNAVWVRNSIDLPLALLVGWILITIPFSIDPAYSFVEWRKLAARILVFYWALLVLKNNTGTDYWKSVIVAVLVGASTVGFYGIWYFIENGGQLLDLTVRAQPPLSNSPWLATLMLIALPFAAICFRWVKTHREKLVLGGVLCLLLLAEFFAYSRGTWLGLAAMGFGYGVLRKNWRVFAGCILLSVAFVSVLFGVSRLGYLEMLVVPDSIVDRLACSLLAVKELLHHPVVGTGFGTDIFQQLYPGDPPGACKGNHSHNAFLLYAMGSGVPAIIFLLWAFAVIIKKFSQDARDGKSTEVASVKLAVALTALGYGVAVASNDLFTGSLAHLFWILVAVGFSLSDQEEQRPARHMPESS